MAQAKLNTKEVEVIKKEIVNDGVTLNLTMDEAKYIYRMTGEVIGGGPNRDLNGKIYWALNGIFGRLHDESMFTSNPQLKY